MAGADEAGAHIFYNCPSGNFYDYKAFAMGARSQAAKTYLERHFESFADASVDELVRHALQALHSSLQDGDLTEKNCSVSIVGVDQPFTVLEDEALGPFVAAVRDEDGGVMAAEEEAQQQPPAPAAADEEGGGGGGGGDDGAAPMED